MPELSRATITSSAHRAHCAHRELKAALLALLVPMLTVSSTSAQSNAPAAVPNAAPNIGARVVEFYFTPVGNAQVALWIEDGAGKFLSTVALTEAVSRRGIGNRPGASQMNSGFRWPYGRREGVLPIWAHRRMTAPGAKPFRRVIFQKRASEGHASRTFNADDFSRDDYFCLSFNNSASRKEALDAVSCASVFSSDKGRYLTDVDAKAGYSEPYEDVATRVGRMEPLSTESLYPPRRDVKPCMPSANCYEAPEVAQFDADARAVMPEIDTVSMATPKGGELQQRLFSVPAEWSEGSYKACLEINVEGDYNAAYDPAHFPTPQTPMSSWDSWATTFGYPYRGQPSVVYCTPFTLRGGVEGTFSAVDAEGTAGSWDTAAQSFGTLASMNGMSMDPALAPGSGGDRLHRDAQGKRFTVVVKPPLSCETNTAPTAVDPVSVKPYPDEQRAHEWAEIDFKAASDDGAVFRYDVRVSTEPIVDEASFMRGQPAKSATIEADELRIPADAAAGTMISVDMGGLIAETHYFVGVRAIDGCASGGKISTVEYTTGPRVFATVTPCFVATAAYGTPFAAEISALRRFRDRHLANHAIGRAFVSAYGSVGPKLASIIRERDGLRAFCRTLLSPAVAVARWLDD